MGAKIKLQRRGAKKKPFYRLVIQDDRAARNSKIIEVLGHYDPLKEPSLFEINKEKIQAWLSKGAEPTDKVRILLGKAGILPPVDLASLPKKKPRAEKKAEAAAAGEKKESPAAPAKAEAEVKEEVKEEAKKEEGKPENAPKEEQK